MGETAMRYIAMLQHVPRHPAGITATGLHAKLLDLGFRIDKRSVERDLNHLASLFPLTASESRPAQWCWMRDAHYTMLPGLDPASALAYELAARYLAPVMPRRSMAALESHFKAARQILDGLKASSSVARWSSKIAVLPSSQPLLPPEVASDVTEVVYEALLTGRRFEVSYRAPESERAKRYPISPFGLVLQGGALYLVGAARDYPDPHVFALHRMAHAVLLDEPATIPEGFDLARHVQDEHTFEHPYGDEIRLELRISPWLARYLGERRLAHDQTLATIRGDDHLRLRATVPDTGQLRWWLRSLGTEVEVLRPRSLRREMAAEIAELAKTYRTPA
jgi:predicted DNA-binding transcriptional regulator YafY